MAACLSSSPHIPRGYRSSLDGSHCSAGTLIHVGKNNFSEKERQVRTNQEIIIGRDPTRCHWIFDDPHMSQRHVRVYVVMLEMEDLDMEPLVYAEDLSRNGTYWNGSLMSRKSSPFLLSDGDRLRLTSKTSLIFRMPSQVNVDYFDLTQEREMRKFRDKYVLTDRVLSTGVFGHVFMAIDQRTRTQLACKVVDLRMLGQLNASSQQSETVKDRVMSSKKSELITIRKWIENQIRQIDLEKRLNSYFREFEILASCKHPNIIGIDKVLVTDNTLYIFHDLGTAGDLLSYTKARNGRLLELEAAAIVQQVVIAVCYLHDKQIAHRDLKSENIMLTNHSVGLRVVLTNFGFARRLLGLQLTSTGLSAVEHLCPKSSSLTYISNSQRHYFAADMLSIGVITIRLLVGNHLFNDALRQCNLNFDSYGDLSKLEASNRWRDLGEHPKNLAQRLLEPNECERLTAKQALSHSWFSTEGHQTDFKILYEQSIRHWRARIPGIPLIEFIKDRCQQMNHFDCAKRVQVANTAFRNSQGRSQDIPVDPPYKPFYKILQSQVSMADERKKRSHSQKLKDLRRVNKEWREHQPSSSDNDVDTTPSRKKLKTGHFNSLIFVQPQNEVLQNDHIPTEEGGSRFPVATHTTRPSLLMMQSFRAPDDRNIGSLKKIVRSPHEPAQIFHQLPSKQYPDQQSSGIQPVLRNEGNITSDPSTVVESKSKSIVRVGASAHVIKPQKRWTLDVQSQSKLNPRSHSFCSSPAITVNVPVRSIFDVKDNETDRKLPPLKVELSKRMDMSKMAPTRPIVLPHRAHLSVSPDLTEI